ncbi:MAG: transcription-repair coupling factor [Chromatiales bacterium]|nr:transcription-repair coupling factor [Chromatiales bacterium]
MPRTASPEALLTPRPPLPERPGTPVLWPAPGGCGLALALSSLITGGRPRRCLVLLPSVSEAEALKAELGFFCGAAAAGIELFPDAEVLPYDSFSPHQDLVSHRLATLRALRDGEIRMLLVAVPTLLPRLAPRRFIDGYSIGLRRGQALDPEQLRVRLEHSGYRRVSQVIEHGEYALRGSLLDFFPMGYVSPVRVDFLDREIDSIRPFDPDSQLSSGQLETLELLPAREFASDAAAITRFRQAYRRRFEGNPARSLVYREVSEGRMPGGIESYLPLFFDETALLWDYLPDDFATVTVGDPVALLERAWAQLCERHAAADNDLERPPLAPEELCGTVDEHLAAMARRPAARFEDPAAGSSPPGPGPLVDRRSAEPVQGLRELAATTGARLLLVPESPGRQELLNETLAAADMPATPVEGWEDFAGGDARLAVTTGPLRQGAVLEDARIVILAERELFGESGRRRRRSSRGRDPAQLIADLTDLGTGDPIVHLDHGVGRYQGLTTLTMDGLATEFLTLEYAGGDRILVPVGSLHRVMRYTGGSAESAPLHRLGTDQWEKARRRAAEKLRDVAAELLELYARRESRTRERDALDRDDYEAFADGFRFELTEDQARAIDAVLADLSGPKPMDRLVCGDVGFGKTEVALRAAFVAAHSGRQVAVLVPTTLLAQQHYQTFADRFAGWPLRVEVLSRFRSARESRAVLAGIEDGTVDVVIGTHRLIQGDLRFRRLGLIIIDEEHRFGVRHKEKLKALRTEADVLTLTATPIPRTLSMAIGQLRDLSLITTPPESRLSIRTFITRWDERTIREACLREINRGGQVYFVHNHIEDIQRVAEALADIVPQARIETAHGQMREKELEQIMLDFYHRRFHILVCTAIIESGLDVPTANTIIINRADRLGLAQLHQLRGRVGRSHHQAFAYLLAPPREAMTGDAAKRLDAIGALGDLGSGFLLATHDMEIRGAGELLGEDQSGQMQEVGFELYNDMLHRAIEALREGREPETDLDEPKGAEIDLHLPALLPDDYMPDIHLRLVHYKRIASADSAAALDQLKIELIDRFGLLPGPTRNLFRITALKLEAVPLGISRINAAATGGYIEFSSRTTVRPETLVQLIQSDPATWRLDREQRLRFSENLDDPESRFRFVEQAVQLLLAGRRQASIRVARQ